MREGHRHSEGQRTGCPCVLRRVAGSRPQPVCRGDCPPASASCGRPAPAGAPGPLLSLPCPSASSLGPEPAQLRPTEGHSLRAWGRISLLSGAQPPAPRPGVFSDNTPKRRDPQPVIQVRGRGLAYHWVSQPCRLWSCLEAAVKADHPLWVHRLHVYLDVCVSVSLCVPEYVPVCICVCVFLSVRVCI